MGFRGAAPRCAGQGALRTRPGIWQAERYRKQIGGTRSSARSAYDAGADLRGRRGKPREAGPQHPLGGRAATLPRATGWPRGPRQTRNRTKLRHAPWPARHDLSLGVEALARSATGSFPSHTPSPDFRVPVRAPLACAGGRRANGPGGAGPVRRALGALRGAVRGAPGPVQAERFRKQFRGTRSSARSAYDAGAELRGRRGKPPRSGGRSAGPGAPRTAPRSAPSARRTGPAPPGPLARRPPAHANGARTGTAHAFSGSCAACAPAPRGSRRRIRRRPRSCGTPTRSARRPPCPASSVRASPALRCARSAPRATPA